MTQEQIEKLLAENNANLLKSMQALIKGEDESKYQQDESGAEDKAYFEWSEVEIMLVDRDNLLGYVQENFDILFSYGLAEEAKPKPKTAKDLRDEQIKALEKDALSQSDMLAMYEMIVGQ